MAYYSSFPPGGEGILGRVVATKPRQHCELKGKYEREWKTVRCTLLYPFDLTNRWKIVLGCTYIF